MTRRVLSLVCALILFVSVTPLSAFASSENDFGTESLEATSPISGVGAQQDTDTAELGQGLDAPSSQDVASDVDFKPLSADDPGVDPTRIVAWPKERATTDAIEEAIEIAADEIDALEETDILTNPEDRDRESLVIVESDPELTEDLMEEMMNSGLFELVDFDVFIEPFAYTSSPNDPYFDVYPNRMGTWGLHPFPGGNFRAVWPLLGSAKGSNTVIPVAVIDTGMVMSHEDRGPNILPGYDFGSDRPTVSPQTSSGPAYHGTGTGGLIGAYTNNARGIAGAAYDNQVIVYKAANASGVIPLSAVANSIKDVTAKKNARIINMSLGGAAFPLYLRQAIDDAVDAGILVIASAGNSAQYGNPVLYPAAYERVLSVASIGPDGKWSTFSTYNSGVDIAAPGELISVMGRDNTYPWSSGTSFAAPYVASAAAMAWRAAPNLTAVQVKNILLATAHPIGTRGNTKTGAGAVDAYAAFKAAQGLPYQPKITSMKRGKGSVTVNWKKDSICPYPAKSYLLQYQKKGQNTWNSISVQADGATGTATISGLKEGKVYYFRVATINENGKGPYSTPVAAKSLSLSIISTASTVKLKKGETKTIRVAPKYMEKQKVKIAWKTTKPKVASVSNMGSSAQSKGKGSWKANTLTDKSVSKNGKKLTIKGLSAGTSYITFSSSYAKYKIKVIVQ